MVCFESLNPSEEHPCLQRKVGTKPCVHGLEHSGASAGTGTGPHREGMTSLPSAL